MTTRVIPTIRIKMVQHASRTTAQSHAPSLTCRASLAGSAAMTNLAFAIQLLELTLTKTALKDVTARAIPTEKIKMVQHASRTTAQPPAPSLTCRASLVGNAAMTNLAFAIQLLEYPQTKTAQKDVTARVIPTIKIKMAQNVLSPSPPAPLLTCRASQAGSAAITLLAYSIHLLEKPQTKTAQKGVTALAIPTERIKMAQTVLTPLHAPSLTPQALNQAGYVATANYAN